MNSINLQNKAFVWDPGRGEKLLNLRGHRARVIDAAWNSNDTRIVTVSADGEAIVWDARTGRELFRLSGHHGRIKDVAWNSDDTRIITAGGDNRAIVWDAETGKMLFALQQAARVQQAEWNADDTLIATTSYDGRTIVWNAQTGRGNYSFLAWSSKANRFAWSSDGTRIVTTAPDGQAVIYDAHTGAKLHTLQGHTGSILDLAWSPDDRHIVTGGSGDASAIVWDSQTGAKILTLNLPRYSIGVRHLAWSSDGARIVTTSWRYRTQIWNAQTGKLLIVLGGRIFIPGSAEEHVEWNADDTLIATTEGGKVKLWDAQTGVQILTLRGHSGGVSQVAWSSDSTRILVTFGLSDRRRDYTGLFLLLGFLLAVVSGLRAGTIETKTVPNQGIKSSVRNAVFIGLVVTPILGSALGMIAVVGFIREAGIGMGLRQGLLLGLSFSPLVMLWYSGIDIVQHFILRVILRCSGDAPWRLARFLNYADERVFLRKVGGSYIFIHRLLQDYFASLYQEE